MELKLLTRPDAAEVLNISLRTLDELLASGKLPAVRIGKAIRFRPETIRKFIEENEGKAVPRLPRKR